MKLLKTTKVSGEKDYLAHYKLDYELDNGKPYTYEMVSRVKNHTNETIGKSECNAVTIFATTADNELALVIDEFRMPVNKVLVALPAGLIDPGESPETTAIRELEEETGYNDVTVNLVLPPAYSTPGLTDESVSIVYCTLNSLNKNEALRESTESIESRLINKEQAKEILAYGNIGTRSQLLLLNWMNS